MLSEKIKMDTNIKGIKLDSLLQTENIVEYRTIQYADDVVLIMKDEESLDNALKIIKQFTNTAGPRLNINKSEIIATGKFKVCTSISNIHTRNTVKCLGIHVGHNKLSCDKKNWDEKIFKLEKTLFSWKKRNLTFFGKITILKTLGLSPLIFSMQNTAMPEGKVELINKIVYSFLWKKQERIKRKTMIGNIEQGGLSMIDVESFHAALKTKWVGRIINNSDKWSAIGNHLINSFASDRLLLKIHVHDIRYIRNMPPFYRQVIECCVKIKSFIQEEPTTINELLNQPIWHNKYLFTKIRHRKRSIFLSNWIKSGILYVKDLDYSEGHVSESYIIKHLKNKSNFLIEMKEIKEALRPYKLLLAQIPESLPVKDTALQYLNWTTKQLCKCYVNNSFIKPEYQMISQTIPDVTSLDIRNSIKYKIIKRTDNILAQFSFKIFHNILVCGKILHKWTNISRNCPTCQSLHDIPHMLYFCKPSENVWKNVSDIMGFKVELKHILLFYDNDNYENIKINNYCFTAISYCIYKYWLQCTEKKTVPNEPKLIGQIVTDLRQRSLLLKSMNKLPEIRNLLIKIVNGIQS